MTEKKEEPFTVRIVRLLVGLYQAARARSNTAHSLDLAYRHWVATTGKGPYPDPRKYQESVIRPLEQVDHIASALVHYVYNYCPLNHQHKEFKIHADVYADSIRAIYNDGGESCMVERSQDGLPPNERGEPTSEMRFRVVFNALLDTGLIE